MNRCNDYSLGLGETDTGETSLTPGLRTVSAHVGRPVRLAILAARAMWPRLNIVAASGLLSGIDEG